MHASNPLDQPLPEALRQADSRGARAWRAWPVFSWPWLWRRSVVFGSVVSAIAAFTGLGHGVARHDAVEGLVMALHMFVGFGGMCTIGPGLATLARHRRWPEARERIAVVAAILFGLATSALLDQWVSGHVTRSLADPGAEARIEATVKGPDGPATPAGRALNVLLLLSVYAALGGGFALRAYFAEGSRLRALQHAQELESLRRAKQEGDLRLGVLQAQVEPHFLFNTLASVRSMVREEPARAEAAIDALVDYLRATIPRLRADGTSLDTPLAMQFEVCRSYLALMRARMGERLRVSIDLPPALAGAPFPPLLLLTLVENAIKHGIEPRPGPGHVWLAARRIESGGGALLEVEVGDDGAGLGAAMGHGVGLANVRAQLATRYGARAGLEVSGRAGGGVLATLRVPLEAGA
jgi:hypothetical protein